MRQVTHPGIFVDFPGNDYFSDPCPVPSLTQSIAKILLDKSPAHARLAHPRLNPNYEHNEDAKFAIGNAAHKTLIGRGKELTVIEANDWRTKAAKEERDAAIETGNVPILAHQYERSLAMVHAAQEQIAAVPEIREAFRIGMGEVVIAAEVDGVWLRSMIDWMHSPATLYDYKTTAKSAAPHNVPYVMADAGWDIQAAIQERILDALEPGGAGRRKHYFILQETAEPYAMTPVLLPESVMTIGRKKLDAAITIWRSCTVTGKWPGYSQQVISPSYPAYAEARILERLMADDEGEEDAA